MQQHLLYETRPRFGSRNSQRSTSSKGSLISPGFRTVTKDLFSQGSDPGDTHGTVGLVIGKRLPLALPMYQRSPRNKIGVHLFVAVTCPRKTLPNDTGVLSYII